AETRSARVAAEIAPPPRSHRPAAAPRTELGHDKTSCAHSPIGLASIIYPDIVESDNLGGLMPLPWSPATGHANGPGRARSKPMARYDFRTPRLYTNEPLAAGATIALAKPQAHYLSRVLRRKTGDTVLLFNGRDGEWRA